MANNAWADLSDEENRALENVSSCFIFKAPEKLKCLGKERFVPSVVSIGPYHHKEKNLKVTDKHKRLYLKYFIARNRSPTTVLNDMVAKIRLIQVASCDCYDGDMGHGGGVGNDAFVQMLILDGCFILELFHQHTLREANPFAADPVILFNNNWCIPSLRRDLVLLENQIPFDVLLCLYCISIHKTTTNITQPEKLAFSRLILSFFDPILPTIQKANIDTPIQGKHLLDLLRNYVLNQHEGEPNVQQQDLWLYAGDELTWEHTSPAKDLQDAGVHFMKKDTNTGLLNITFYDGRFEIPPFHFGESWTALFPNMIALEQCRKDYRDRITSYAILMDNLIDSKDDVKLLRDKGIISRTQLEDEVIATIMNNLCKGAIVDEFHYDWICNQANAYRRSWRNQWRADFKRNYMDTPWAGVSLLAAIFLLVLTMIQAIFGIISWQLPKK